MSEASGTSTVYVLGAGANKVLRSRDGRASPPLLRDFFKVARKIDYWLGQGHHTKTQGQRFREKYQRIYEHIMRYWKRDVDEMDAFDLEELFTLLLLQADDALTRGDQKLGSELTDTFIHLTTYLAEVLQEFQGDTAFGFFSDFAKGILEENSSVITFNYDTFLERAMETARPNWEYPQQHDAWKAAPEKTLPPKFHNWDRALAYGVPFDTVEAGPIGTWQTVDGKHFYSQPGNELYDSPILKLHGSLNWFSYAPADNLPPERLGQVALLDWYHQKEHFGDKVLWPELGGLRMLPVIVTPDLNKGRHFSDGSYGQFLRQIWEMAGDLLSHCARLVVVGYSFSPTDFFTRKLFRQSFERHDLQELVVVNPNAETAGTAKDLCHFTKSVTVCGNLEEFLEPADKGHAKWNRALFDRKTLEQQLTDEDSTDGFLIGIRGECEDDIVATKNAKLPAEGQYIVLPVSDWPKKRVLGWFRVSSVHGSPLEGLVLTVVAALPPPGPDEEGAIFSPD